MVNVSNYSNYKDVHLRKELGRAYLTTNRIREGLEVYAGILADYPKDIETYIVFGDFFLAEGRLAEALIIYELALRERPDEPDIISRMNLARAEYENLKTGNRGKVLMESEIANPKKLIELIHKMFKYSPSIKEEEIARAKELFDEVFKSSHPSQVISEHLHEIDILIPGLIGLNVKKAQLEGRSDIVRSLQELYDTFWQCEEDLPSEDSALELPHSYEELTSNLSKILIIHQSRMELSNRLGLVSSVLKERNIQVDISQNLPTRTEEKYDAIIVQAPITNFQLLENLAAWSAKGIPIIVSLESDVEQLPITHPDYELLGLNTVNKAKNYSTLLLLADVICVSSSVLASTLISIGYPVKVIPDGWSKSNGMWDKSPVNRHNLNLGWMRDPGQLEDIAMIRRILLRIMREFSHVCLVIVGDPKAYQIFEKVPEHQRLFLPLVNFDDYPYLLNQIDLLLVPSRNTPYNRSFSDRRYVEAGARCIPWIGSPLPSAISWGVGGLIANSLDEWYLHLRQLILDPELRVALGQNGRQYAEEREMGKLIQEWIDMMNLCILRKRNGNHKGKVE